MSYLTLWMPGVAHAGMHTTVRYCMHELDIACKHVLISHDSMIHAYACCTCNLMYMYKVILFPLTLR